MQTDPMILQRLDAITARLDELAERRRATDELVDELMPIAREALATAVERFDAAERQGVFSFLAELVEVGRRVVAGFSPADVHALGDAIVPILDVLRALSAPEILQIAGDAAAALHDAPRAAPLGVFKAARATREDDVQKGLGVLVDVLRRIGHGARGANGHDGKALDPQARLSALLGPRRATHALPAPAPTRKPVAPPPAPPPPDPRPVDPAAWTRAVAESIAGEQGIVLDAPRWALIDAARADYAATHAAPNIQRLTSVAGVTTKDLYLLFPKAPARTIARIAGLPKPAGCL
jgi:TusE/DsrC/DsvC family sulfur relay protein